MSVRIGQGFDVHAFGPGDRVRLGGVGVGEMRADVAERGGAEQRVA